MYVFRVSVSASVSVGCSTSVLVYGSTTVQVALFSVHDASPRDLLLDHCAGSIQRRSPSKCCLLSRRRWWFRVACLAKHSPFHTSPIRPRSCWHCVHASLHRGVIVLTIAGRHFVRPAAPSKWHVWAAPASWQLPVQRGCHQPAQHPE